MTPARLKWPEPTRCWPISGTRIDPLLIHSIRAANGDVVEDFQNDKRPVLDPRVASVVTNMMQNVIDHGTGFTVRRAASRLRRRARPAPRTTRWFAGYTSNLLCIVWVGYDDYSDLKLAGGSTAGPIWAEFMKRAVRLPQYSNTTEFAPPSGVVTVSLDKTTNLIATASCPDVYNSVFVEGSEPKDTCDHADQRNILPEDLRRRATCAAADQPAGPSVPPNQPRQTAGAPGGGQNPSPQGQPGPERKEKRILGQSGGHLGCRQRRRQK